ncbi:hypothetical protein BU16DRAFT_543629 [Lophium mytilinum]|uniref:Apple domain-containing protein n=1 Tax=Lophium mytilinum TaxID=390894 RepID=A0A6A6QDR2_9PEZI|nr:hypothetical protein BU16DRAFT_543629 [Lophium mytilinum]
MPQFSFARLAALLAIVPVFINASPTFRKIGRAPSTVSCPSSDGQTVTIGTSSFQITCDYDYWGGDITMSWETTLSNCLATCSTTTGCVAISYNGGACYMKDSADNGQSNTGVWAAKKVATPSSSSATTSSTSSATTTSSASVATTTPETVSCPESDGLAYTAKDGATYLIQCSTDFYGGDLSVSWESDLGSCIEACEATPDCVDVAYRPGTPGPCYLKSTFRTPVSNSEVWGAVFAPATALSTISSAALSTSSSSPTTSVSASATLCPVPTCSPPAGPISPGTIMDPGFETPGTTPDWALIDGQLADTAGGFYFEYKNGDVYSAHSGTHYGHQTFGSRTDWGKFGTTILDLTPCAQYTVTFWVLKNTNAHAVISTESCSLDAVPLGGPSSYKQYSFTFTATGTTANFAITGSCPAFDGACGLLYDDFEIAPVQAAAATSTTSTASSTPTPTPTPTATPTPTPTPVPSGCGLIQDMDFETPGTSIDWTVPSWHSPAGTARGGTHYGYQSIFSGGGGHFGTTITNLNVNTPYSVAFWVKKNIYADVWIMINGINGNIRIPPASAGGLTDSTVWYHQSFVTMAFSTSVVIEFDTTCPGYDGQCDVYWDDFSVYPVTGVPAGCPH